MTIDIKRRLNQAVTAVALFCTVMQPTYALTLATQPLFLGPAVPPQVMLTLSKDQQLYKKAYNDYSDLDGDGDPETTYKHSITYYGYFDPIKCYAYTAANQFEPVSITTFAVPDLTKTPAGTKPGSAYCDDSTGRWSGNFLNWISMSRMDAVRKLLYGGLRQVDSQTDTVLERAFIPTDAHAWAKYYNGADIAKLTPFTTTVTTPADNNETTTSNVLIEKKAQDLQINFSGALNYVALGDQLRIQIRNKPTQYMIGAVMAIANANKRITVRIDPAGVSGEGNSDNDWTVTNLSTTGISFCNLTPGTSGPSQSNTNAPVIRAVKGNFALWNANELWQCQWSEDRNFLQASFNGVRSNGNQASLSDINASAENPSRAVHGLGGSGTTQGQYVARVKVCVSDALKGSENCRQYPKGNLKPVGLLQQFGEDNSIHFGLMTGSYAKNISGGVLRKNVGTFTDELSSSDYGQFTNLNGIVATINKMRIYGYDYGGGTYLPAAPGGDNCTYQLTSITENSCTSWGNPMSEIYHEAIRYFASTNQPTPAYTYTSSGSKDASLVVPNGAPAGSVAGLPLPTWKAPISQANVCSKLNVLVFNASVSTNDDDLGNTVGVNTNKTVRELTNAVGDAEGITNGNYFIGKRTGDGSGTTGFELCTAKTVTAFGDVSGICPEGPTLGGSYLLAGLAYQAHTNPIRSDLNAGGDPGALKVTSYGIQLATNTPQLTIPIPGRPGQKVVIQPTYRLDLGSGNFGGGSIVDMKYVRQSVTGSIATGKVYINWEDSEQGGDYDQDMWGTLEWTLNAATNKLTITTNAISASSVNPQGFGYTVSGTTQDGPHFHSGIYGFLFTDPTGVRGCATRCRHPTDPNVTPLSQIGPQSWTYDIDTSKGAANSLNDPLWYLAKYGGFVDANQDGSVDAGEWDLRNNITGAAAGDGVPDNYFLVTNPLGLEDSLRKALSAITATGSGSAVSANSTSLSAGAAVFAARFNAKDWSGELAASALNTDGTLGAQYWEAGQSLPAPDSRVILTYLNNSTTRKGVPFRWPGVSPNPSTDIGANLVNALNTMPENPTSQDGRGALRLAYLRGDGSNEGPTTNGFRSRTRSKLGDIANSNPAYVPAVPNSIVLDTSYKAFRDRFIANPRKPMVYVGANDGMLHGFLADTTGGGREMMAYVPSKTYTNLNQLTNKSYVHRYYVDGSPTVADAFVSNAWKTVLVGALGSGGRGLFALDVTTPQEPVAGSSVTAEQQAASNVLWEFNAEDDAGLGYVLGQPLIRKMNNGRWAAIVSGGYNNAEAGATQGDGKAYLFIIFLDGPTGPAVGNNGRTWQLGTDYIRLDTGTGTLATPNGLAPPFAADMNSDGMVDFLYAGDLFGTLWKFDVSEKSTIALWSDVKRRVPLFTGSADQPITGAVEAAFHPTGRGLIVMFGTGKYLEPSDPVAAASGTPFKPQSFYGIWDRNDNKDISQQTKVVGTSTLFQQVINDTGTFRYITPAILGATGPNWSTNLGWFMDFPNSQNTGERTIAKPLLASRRLIFSTIVPGTGACDSGGTSFLMVVNPGTGGAFTTPVFDTNGDGFLTPADVVGGTFFASGLQVAGLMTTPSLFSGAGTRKESTLLNSDSRGRVSGTSGGVMNTGKTILFCTSKGVCPPGILSNGFADEGRASWREVVKK
jgi:type IV pilus assembly protein PilY1